MANTETSVEESKPIELGNARFSIDFQNELEIEISTMDGDVSRWLKPEEGEKLLQLLTRWLRPQSDEDVTHG